MIENLIVDFYSTLFVLARKLPEEKMLDIIEKLIILTNEEVDKLKSDKSHP